MKDNIISIFEDEVDAALANENIEALSTTIDIDTDEPDETTDTNITYTDIPGATSEDIDADDIIAAERDLATIPSEDDEIIDAAINGDYSVDLSDDE